MIDLHVYDVLTPQTMNAMTSAAASSFDLQRRALDPQRGHKISQRGHEREPKGREILSFCQRPRRPQVFIARELT